MSFPISTVMNVIVVLFLAASAFAAPTANYELKFVTFVHRHGDRSPIGSYPTDPHRNESLWNNGWGELTTTGKQRAYDLGKWLRKRYATFLPEIYNKRDFEVQSTDVSRTLMSAYLVLAGLYEPKGTDVWNPNIKWQPIPVHTTPQKLDNVLAAKKPCPKHARLYKELLSSKEIKSKLDPVADALSKVVKLAGYNSSDVVTNFLTSTMIYDSLNVQRENGLALPKWSQPYFPQPLQNLNMLMLRLPTYNKPLQRLGCGLLVKDILEHFKSKSRGELNKKIWQYSAHDITIVALSQCLGFKNSTYSTPYTGALIMELSIKDGQYYTQVLHKADNQLTTLTIPGCTEYCPLKKFEELVTPIIPTDWEEECKLWIAPK